MGAHVAAELAILYSLLAPAGLTDAKTVWRAGGDEDRSSLENAVAQVRDDSRTVKMYSDFKSPYAYLAFDPAMALPERFAVQVRWIPFQLRLKGKGERSVYSEYKVKYSYMDARRWAKPRGLWIRGPLKIYDTTPAAMGGLFAQKHGRFLDYGRAAFKQFFLREFEADQAEAVAQLLARPRLSHRDYLAYFTGDSPAAY